MLKAIIAREFFNNILNLRFIVGLVLCIIITIACVMILTHDYSQEMKDFNLRVNLQDEFLDNYAHNNRMSRKLVVEKPPERFRPLLVGISKDTNIGSFDDSPLSMLFPPLDFIFIVTIIMSLLAVLFSYDAITGERQSGTLRLVVSNSVSRAKILFGKWIGGTASLLIPFILSLLAGALYISINPAIQWDGSAWTEFTLLTIGSVTFIASFYLLGLVVSTFSRYSATSILNCLFLWVLLVLVIPNICPYISAQLYRIPSIREIERQCRDIDNAQTQVARQRSREVIRKFANNYGKLFSEFESMELGGLWGRTSPANRKAAQDRAAADPEFNEMVNAFREQIEQAWEEPMRLRREAADKLWKDLHTKAAAQSRFAKNIACISPLADFVYLATDLTGTGLRSLDYFKRTADEYYDMFLSYCEKKTEQAMKKNPAFDRLDSFLDVSDRPRFVFKEEPLRDKLNAVLPYWGILVLFNVVFFAAAFAGFMRYDVR